MADRTGSIDDCALVHQRDPALSETVPCPWVTEGEDGFSTQIKYLNYSILPDGRYENLDDLSMESADTKALVQSWAGGDSSNTDLVQIPAEQEGTTTTSSPAKATASGPDRAPAAAAASGTWRMAKVTVTNYSHYANYQYNGSKVVAWGSRGDYTSNESSVVDVRERMSNTRTALPASPAYTYMKRKIALTAPVYGEYSINYPWIRIRLNGNGTTSFTYAAY
jgi:hypothetical protein